MPGSFRRLDREPKHKDDFDVAAARWQRKRGSAGIRHVHPQRRSTSYLRRVRSNAFLGPRTARKAVDGAAFRGHGVGVEIRLRTAGIEGAISATAVSGSSEASYTPSVIPPVETASPSESAACEGRRQQVLEAAASAEPAAWCPRPGRSATASRHQSPQLSNVE